ncbi:hypothetical protein MK372_07430, partial [Streptococcus oralis]
NYM